MGVESITAAIRQKAADNASAAIAAAEKSRDEKLSASKARLDADSVLRQERLEKEKGEVRDRRLTLARLESRIAVLNIKQRVIEKAYRQVAERLDKMSADKYCKIFSKLVSAYAESGDELLIGKSDAGRLDTKWAERLCGEFKLKLSQSGFDGKGVILSNKTVEKDLTVPTLLSQIREKTESKTAEILFGKE